MKASIFAMIPARKGSKRFPRKNKTKLCGKPLISWTIESAIEANIYEQIIVSSDDPDILAIAGEYSHNKVIAMPRPKELAADNVSSAKVLSYVIQELEQNGQAFDQVSELLPTCPWRSAEDIRQSIKLLDDTTDSVISVKNAPCIPNFILQTSSDGKARPVMENSSFSLTRRQDYPDIYYPNGAIYHGWTHKYKLTENFYSSNIKLYPMPDYRSVDIDIPEDMTYAEAIWKDYIQQAK